nr:uncharacterized protein LOC117680964 [Crassostrea gigas]
MNIILKSEITSGIGAALECSYCNQRSTDLLRCSRCKEVYYCSGDCQRGHWREGHREQCKLVTSQDSMVCRFCYGSSKRLKRCVGRLQVSYCSKECQKEDWSRRHRVECKAMKPLEREMTYQIKSEVKDGKKEQKPYERQNKTEDGKNRELLDCCSVCRKNADLKGCKECHKIKYCSRECQRVDWKTQKTSCKREKGETGNDGEKDDETLSICAHCRVKGTHNACENCSAVFYCSESCQRLDWGKHKTACKLGTGKTKTPETLTVEQCTLFGLVTPEENNGVDPNDIHIQTGDKQLLEGLRFFCNRCKDL